MNRHRSDVSAQVLCIGITYSPCKSLVVGFKNASSPMPNVSRLLAMQLLAIPDWKPNNTKDQHYYCLLTRPIPHLKLEMLRSLGETDSTDALPA